MNIKVYLKSMGSTKNRTDGKTCMMIGKNKHPPENTLLSLPSML